MKFWPPTMLDQDERQQLADQRALFKAILEAIENETFRDVAGEAIFAADVDLVGMELNEVEGEEEDF